ncbi:MAG: hypothetical protein J0I79_04995 [Mesorhizobium sp.]|uniref:hypothetical protein n=1 Tax=Mesorhizobium sp. TaxID=1871066 RepID=UPI001AC5A76C|nr:hypothetical protein [Mesorhizobium sp.]MBN9217288.1 hypothetical protein [Mesorhizobium sp.]
MLPDQKAFIETARRDFEFTRETRYLTGIVKLAFGDETWALNFADGALAGIADGRGLSDQECKIVVEGTPDQWDELLKPKPRPFYQCIQSAAVKHGMKLSVSNETFAYLPGLNRMTTLLRDLRNGRAGHDQA